MVACEKDQTTDSERTTRGNKIGARGSSRYSRSCSARLCLLYGVGTYRAYLANSPDSLGRTQVAMQTRCSFLLQAIHSPPVVHLFVCSFPPLGPKWGPAHGHWPRCSQLQRWFNEAWLQTAAAHRASSCCNALIRANARSTRNHQSCQRFCSLPSWDCLIVKNHCHDMM